MVEVWRKRKAQLPSAPDGRRKARTSSHQRGRHACKGAATTYGAGKVWSFNCTATS
jgi:hypothetical protein